MKINNTIKKSIAITLAPLMFVSCATGKHAYDGQKRSLSELATIETVKTKNSKKFIGSHSEIPKITYVDDKQVGNYLTGYPKRIFVIPGDRVIKTEYTSTKATKRGATITGAALGGLVGGGIGASIDRARNADLIELTKKETSVKVEANKKYSLKAESEDGRGNNLKIWLEETE